MGKSTTKTAVVYCRTSTKGQKDAATIEAQIDACGKLVQKHGVQLLTYGPKGDGWLRDDGISGSLLEGRSFAKLIDDLEHSRVKLDYLVTYSMSRLARHDKASKDMAKLVKSATDKARIMAVLNGANVKVIDQDGVNDPASVLTEIKETLSGEEYRMIRNRTMAGKARVLANGAWATGGRVPYGYKRVPVNGIDKKKGTTLAPHEVDGPRFRRVMEWYVEGGAAYASRKAMAEKWPSPRGSKTWYPSTIQQLLNNVRAYLGESTLSIDGQPYDVTYPALIDAKTYAGIERRKKERTLKKRTTLLGTGYVDCGTCGGHVHGSRSSTREYFHVTCRARCTRMREDLFAAKLWELMLARLVQIKEHEQIVSGGKDPYGPQLEAAKAKVTRVQEQLDRILDLYADGVIDKATLNKKSAALREEKAKLQVDVDRLTRERDLAAQKKIGEETVQSRVQNVLRRLRNDREVPLEGKRKILSDLLQGERVILTSVTKTKKPYLTITLPAFGALEPVTVKIDQDVTTQLHGVSREALDEIYSVEDRAEDIAMGGDAERVDGARRRRGGRSAA